MSRGSACVYNILLVDVLHVCCRDGLEHKVERELALAGGRSMSMSRVTAALNLNDCLCTSFLSVSAGMGSNTR
jgi:hypothetical protein